jgi:hypothetical protein
MGREFSLQISAICLAAIGIVGCGLSASETAARVDKLQTILNGANKIEMKLALHDEEFLDEDAATRFKAALKRENIELVRNWSKRIVIGNFNLLHDSSKTGNVLVFKDGVYSHNGVYFRLRHDGIHPIVTAAGNR